MLKVFLVEDEYLIREGIRDKIPWEQYGYQFVGEAADGEVALPLIRKARPDVLITDIKMPFMDGLTLSKIVSEEFPKMKIIIISGHDDFSYAREAIAVGVDQYLLKPVTRTNLRKVLLDLKEKIEQESQQNDYQAQFSSEMPEYEQFYRRRFFEKLLEGEMTPKEIYDEAAKRSIDLSASCYNLMFLYLQEKAEPSAKADLGYSGEIPQSRRAENFARIQNAVLQYFLRYPQYVLFRWNVNSFGVLIKAEPGQMEELAQRAVAHMKRICEPEQEQLDWYVAVGNPEERLSRLPQCYQSANHYFAYRFIMPELHLLNQKTLKDHLAAQENKNISNVDPAKMGPDIIRDFLVKGNSSEIQGFVESHLQGIREALQSRLFRDYMVLNLRFTTLAYLESIGVTRTDCEAEMMGQVNDIQLKADEVSGYFVDILQAAIRIRDRESSYQSSKTLRRALDYIDEHYDEDSLSLSSVAGKVNMSTNYLSSVFSQNIQRTFTEYVTEKRMEKAKHLLGSTDKPASEIAALVGYKDAHYFSFVFKKTQGLSPREYRLKSAREFQGK